MLIIETPLRFDAERHYIASVLLGDWLGLEWRLTQSERSNTRFSYAGSNAELLMPDVLFSLSRDSWLTKKALPSLPLQSWNSNELVVDAGVVNPCIPLIYGDRHAAQCSGDLIGLPIDVFGSAFFMLTRYEEIVKPERDQHGRFPAEASLAYQEGFLQRPIINEYLEILWTSVKYLWPQMKRKERKYRVFLSHDVDSPLYGPWATTKSLIKQVGADAVRRKDLALAWRRAKAVYDARQGHFDEDPHNTFDYIMDRSEGHGLHSSFYFLTDRKSHMDGAYSIEMPWIKQLLTRISARGHEIGLHTSYETYRDSHQTQVEFDLLRSVTEECGIQQDHWGGRQHYLRWRNGDTWRNWEAAGLAYDSTLGYAQCAGFRAGTCYEYAVFDLVDRRRLKLRERPLIVMETMLLSPHYMGLSDTDAFETVLSLSSVCRRFSGDFALLWHNSKLVSRRERRLYEQCLAEAV